MDPTIEQRVADVGQAIRAVRIGPVAVLGGWLEHDGEAAKSLAILDDQLEGALLALPQLLREAQEEIRREDVRHLTAIDGAVRS